MKKKLSAEQEALLKKFKNVENNSKSNFSENKNDKAISNAPKPTIRRSGSRGK